MSLLPQCFPYAISNIFTQICIIRKITLQSETNISTLNRVLLPSTQWYLFVWSLTPLSTALVISRRSVHLPMFSWLSHTSTYTTFFRSHWLLSHIDQRWEAMENIARKNVAATGYRTRDLQITSQIRYQLSYPAGSSIIEWITYD